MDELDSIIYTYIATSLMDWFSYMLKVAVGFYTCWRLYRFLEPKK